MNKFPMRALSCALSGLVLCLASAQAATQFSFTIKGTVVSGPACILNANTAIDVKFGSALQTTSIDGSNYATPVPFTLTCVGNPSSLRLRFHRLQKRQILALSSNFIWGLRYCKAPK